MYGAHRTPPLGRSSTIVRPLSSLLVIDNAEHHLTTCAELCRAILAGAPQLTILITSRAPHRRPRRAGLPDRSAPVACQSGTPGRSTQRQFRRASCSSPDH